MMKNLHQANFIDSDEEIAAEGRLLLLNGFIDRLQGIHKLRHYPMANGVIFSPSTSVHTFTMKKPIDIYFIDKGNLILKAVKDKKPFGMVSNIRDAHYTVELLQDFLPKGREIYKIEILPPLQ